MPSFIQSFPSATAAPWGVTGAHLGRLRYTSDMHVLFRFIAPTPSGNVWVGNGTELWAYQAGVWHTVHATPALPAVSGVVWHANQLWGWSMDQTLINDGATWRDVRSSLPFQRHSDLAIDRTGWLWTCADHQLYRSLIRQDWELFPVPIAGDVSAVLTGTDGTIWVQL